MPRGTVLPRPQHENAFKAILQFLQDQGLQKVVDVLETETQVEYDPEQDLLRPSTLLNALENFGHELEDEQDSAKKNAELVEKSVERLLLDRQDSVTLIPDESTEICLSDCSSKNLLSISWNRHPRKRLVASSSADGSIFLRDLNDSHESATFKMKGVLRSPAIASDFHPIHTDLLAVGCMDGSHAIVDIVKRKVVRVFTDHDRSYVVRVRWSPDGSLLATSGTDHSVCIFKETPGETDDAPNWTLLRRMRFIGTAESIDWLESQNWLLLGARGESYIHAFDAESLQESHRFHVNSNVEDIARFSVMDICSNPNSDFVFASTDRSRSLLLHPSVPHPVHAFYGAVNDEYSTPRAKFGSDDVCIHSTSQDSTVVTWDMRTQKVLNKLEKHTKIIRDLDVNRGSNELAVCSYDKTVRVYSCSSI